MDKDITNTLSILGLSKSEHEAFMILCKLPRGVEARFIADDLEIPRSTAYSTLNDLVKKGIVAKTTRDGTSVFFTSRETITKHAEAKCAAIRMAQLDLIKRL